MRKGEIASIVLSSITLLMVIIMFIVMIVRTKKEVVNTYDVSAFHEASVEGLLKRFENKDTFVVYVGRPKCSVCEQILPTLKKAQVEFGYITEYIDIATVDRNSEDWEKLAKLFDLETTASITEKESDKVETNTFGYFVTQYGFTPTVMLIKDGKQVAGFVGNRTIKQYSEWFVKYAK